MGHGGADLHREGDIGGTKPWTMIRFPMTKRIYVESRARSKRWTMKQ
jgi:hypothetical protein